MGVDVGVSEEVLLNTELFGGFTIRLVPYKSRQDLSVQGTHTQLVETLLRDVSHQFRNAHTELRKPSWM